MRIGQNTLIYIITAIIIATISIQVYWNIIHFKANEAELKNQVHTSLNSSIENYYAKIAKTHVVNIYGTDTVIRMEHDFKRFVSTMYNETLSSPISDRRVSIIIRDSIDPGDFNPLGLRRHNLRST